MGLGSAALVRAALGQSDQAAALLTEISTTPDLRDNPNYAAVLPGLVRTALAIGRQRTAERLVAGVEPVTPYHDHALVTAKAVLAESNGDHQVAAKGYADAAQRWHTFGVLPEHAYALLGQGRCLIALGHYKQATRPLQQARRILATLLAAPALAEIDGLLTEADALSA
jgi:tetratricopeptide (TPR) repeat protein